MRKFYNMKLAQPLRYIFKLILVNWYANPEDL